MDKGYIHVDATISRGMDSRSFIKEGTKTYAGNRDVPFSKTLRPVLEKALYQMKENPLGLRSSTCPTSWRTVLTLTPASKREDEK